MQLQRINDERLEFKNMKNILIIYALQTLGIIGILAYDFVVKGLDGIKENPFLLILFIISTIILSLLSITADERLVLKNLKKIRIAYAVQVIGIVGILAYDFVTKGGFDGVKENPLWLIFIISTAILAFLSMDISIDHENNKDSPKKELIISLIGLVLICTVVGITTSFSEGYTLANGALTAGVFFICGSVPFLFLYNLRKRKGDDL